MILRELRATVVMMPGMNSINAVKTSLCFEFLCQLLCYAVYAANGRHNPDFVANTYITIFADIALECAVLNRDVELLIHRIVCIFESSCEVGLEVVLVYPFSSLEILGCMTDRIAVLDDILTFFLIGKKDLVSGRSILQ
jgi:hypothetical protein